MVVGGGMAAEQQIAGRRFAGEDWERWRSVGDPPADEVAQALLHAHHGVGRDEVDVVGRAVGQAARSVAHGLSSSDTAVRSWLLDGPALPSWADAEAIAVGQRLFASWPLPIATVLFCASLPTTLAAPHGAAVMTATSRMGDRRHVARRLAGTGRMLFDAFDATPPGALLPGHQGYASVRSVRLLHAVVRQGLLAGGAERWHHHGTPVNQEDLLGTMAAFSVTVLDGLATLGIPVDEDEAAGYVHAWCVVGALLGIDDSLVTTTELGGTARALTIAEVREAAEAIATRQLGPSADGRALAEDLFQEMRSSMPPGFRLVPHALAWRLVPDVADMLEVPPPDRVARRSVDAWCRTARAGLRRRPVRWVGAGPGALAGRAALSLLMRRENPSGPAHLADAALLRRAEALDAVLRLTDPPVDADDVVTIALAGNPMTESASAVIRRNRGITAAYADLSARLADVIAGPACRRDANWCTFATWSSWTIGTHLDHLRPSAGEAAAASVLSERDGRTRSALAGLLRRIMRRGSGTGLRVLAAGNRLVFLEVGMAVAAFLAQFPDRTAAAAPDVEDRWEEFWRTVRQQLDVLDPDWALSAQPSPDDLRRAFRHYLLAMRIDNDRLRAQLVLAGNLFLAAHEQRRLQGFIDAALAMSTTRAARSGRRRRGEPSVPPTRVGRLDTIYARAVTWRLELRLPGEVLRVARPTFEPASAVQPPATAGASALVDDGLVTLPSLQVLIDRYELGSGGPPRRARDWRSLEDRMRVIGQLFRRRQHEQRLFRHPFTECDL